MRYVILALVLLASPAHAGSITITVTNDASAVIGSRTFAITTANILRIVAVMKSRYGQVPSGPPDPMTGIVPMRDRTNAEAITAWLNGFMQGTADAVAGDERAAAAAASSGGVVVIPVQ